MTTLRRIALMACAALEGLAVVCLLFVWQEHDLAIAGVSLLVIGAPAALLGGLACMGLTFVRGRARTPLLGLLFLLPWVLPMPKIAYYAGNAIDQARCTPLTGRPTAECEAASCRARATCSVPHDGAVTGAGLCLIGNPVVMACRPAPGGVCAEQEPRGCARTPLQYCETRQVNGTPLCKLEAGRCVEVRPLCGGCLSTATRCEAPYRRPPWPLRR